MPQLPAALPGQLLQWYDENRRILPWREKPSPYRTWISEVMLQQTRVEAGGALAVDRVGFSQAVTEAVRGCPNITVVEGGFGRLRRGAADEAVGGLGLLQPGPQPQKSRHPADART